MQLDHALLGKGVAVPEGLPYGYGPPSVIERLRHGHSSQLKPLPGTGLPPRSCGDISLPIPRTPGEVLATTPPRPHQS